VSMMIGDGIWKTVTSISKPLYATDPSTGNVAWYGLIEEHGQPAYYAMRLKVEGGKVAEVEAVISRSGYPGPFGDPAKYAHDPAFGEVVPRGERQSRKQLVDLVNGYFSTLQLNDGTVRTKFDPDCQRNENGVSTTSGTTFENAVAAQGCEAQFKLGLYKYDDRVRGRRFELVDEEHQIVVATGYIDHAARWQTYQTTDGKTRKSPFSSPNSLGLMEMFKIRHGRIYRIEAVFTMLPYYMTSQWLEREP